jgi:parvulin-like peptidyl-prolyl isomerase
MLTAQYDDNKIIAEVGPIKITVGEFKMRYEMVPHLSKNDNERLKAETLYSIIAEKLWALEAEELGFDSTDIMQYTFSVVKDMNMRDALYRKEISDKIEISPKTFSEAEERALHYLNVRFIHSLDKNEIYTISKNILDGTSFDSILVQRPEYEFQKNKFHQVHFGEMEELAENILYNLKPNEVSTPINSKNDWYIFKLYSIEKEIIADAKEREKIAKDAKQKVETRANNKAYQKFYRSFFPGKKVETDGILFWSFVDKVTSALNNRRKIEKIKNGESVYLTPEDFMQIKEQFGSDSLALPFVQLKNNKISLQQFIHTFAYEGFYSNRTNKEEISSQLNSRVKRFIEHKLLANEANRQGLENLPEVKSEIEMWRGNYLATLYKQTLFDSSNVTDSEIKEYFAKSKSLKKNQILINIIEIFSDNLEVMENILSDLGEGKDFREIALKYSGAKELESGFVTPSSKGEIGKIAKTLTAGEVYGPIKKENGFTIFQLIDKKEEAIEFPKEFNEIKHQLKKELKWKKLSKKMTNNTVKLANKYGVKVDEELLYNIPIKNYNMIVYKYMGFGGRMLAVPLTPSFIEWVEKWEKEKKDLP